MALGKAINFVKQAISDNEFRRKCNKCVSKVELLNEHDFHEGEFEDAIYMQLVKCQSYEAADQVQQIKMWFALL
jgi:hypothetical protein